MKRLRVKKSIVRLTKVALAIMMIFTTFTNLPTLVSADDTAGEQLVEVQEPTNTDANVPVEPAPEPAPPVEQEVPPVSEEQTPVVEETSTVPQEPAPPVEEVQVVSESPVPTETEEVEEVVEEETIEVETTVEQEENVDEKEDEQQEIVETVVLPNTDNVLSNNTTVEEVKEVDQLIYDLGFETQEIMEPTKGFVGDEVEVGSMNVVREGYNFVYWYVLNDDGTETQYNPGDKYVLSEGEDILVAKWEEVVEEVVTDEVVSDVTFSYTVKYALADGTVVFEEKLESQEATISVTAKEEVTDVNGVVYVLSDEASQKDVNLEENTEVTFVVTEKSVEETVVEQAPMMLMMNTLNASIYGPISVNVLAGEQSGSQIFNGGEINANTVKTIEGYSFVKAYVVIDGAQYEVKYAFTYNGASYYSTDGDTALQLENNEAITFEYEKTVTKYTIEYVTKGDTAVSGNTYDGITSVKEGEDLQFSVSTAIGYEAVVIVDGSTLTGTEENDGLTTIYAIDNINSDKTIIITYNKINSFSIDLSWKDTETGREHLHGSSLTSPINDFAPGETVTWTLETHGSYNLTWQFNSLQINRENINIPTNFDSVGSSAETTLQNGKNAGIKVTVTLTDIENNGGYTDYTHTIKIDNAKTDLVLNYANVRGSGHKEVMPQNLQGVELQFLDNSGNWKTMETAVPQAQSEFRLDSVTTGPWWDVSTTNYLQFRYKLNNGYNNVVIYSNVNRTYEGQSDGYTYFNLEKEATLITVSVSASLVNYNVMYNANGGQNAPTDYNSYNVVNAQTLLINSSIPTRDGYAFTGWKLQNGGDAIYAPGQTINISDLDLNDIASNGTLTFVAQWDQNPTEGTYVYYEILYRQVLPNGQFEELKTETKGGIIGKTVVKTGNIDEKYILANGGILKYDPTNSTLSGTVKTDDPVLIITYVRTYTATYDVNGGTGDFTDSNKYTKGDSVTVANGEPTRLGYEFAGWKVEGTDTLVQSGGTFNFPDNKNVALVAQWVVDEGQTKELSATVDYKLGEDVQAADHIELKATVQVLQPDTLSTESVEAKTYKGWKLDNITINGEEVESLPATVNNGDAVVYNYVVDEGQTKELSYSVEYYKDDTLADTDTVIEEVWINSDQTTLTVKKEEINLADKYEGYALDYTDPATIPDTIENGSTIKVYYALDNVGTDKDNPDNPDGIPDKYQVKVDYNAVNGTVSPDYFYVTLTDADGNWSETGSYALTAADMPTTTANSGYENGKWDVTPVEGYEITKDTVFTITYTAIPSPDPDTPTPTPDPTPEPVFTCPEGTVWNEETGMCEVINPVVPPVNIPDDDVDDDDVPPVEEVEELDEDQDEEVVDVDEEETPEVGGDEEVNIDEEETPEVGGRESWALINLIATVLGAVLAIVLLVSKHQKSEEDEENAEEENEYTRRRKWKVISTVTAVVSVIVFVLTENMRLPMVLVDKWTLLMVVFFIINAASLYMGRRFHEEDDDEATQA